MELLEAKQSFQMEALSNLKENADVARCFLIMVSKTRFGN